MNLEAAAALFENVTWKGGHAFMSRCPSHPDAAASLSVREGHTNIMIHCFAGCTFFEVAAAVGVQPIEFKLGGGSAGGYRPTPSARSRLRRFMGRTEASTLADIAEVALSPSPSQLARAWAGYDYLMEERYTEATSRYWAIVSGGPVFELLWDGIEVAWGEPRYYPRFDTRDWFGAREEGRKAMAAVWRMS